MIIAIDVETRGLDATKFVLGCLIKDTGKTVYFEDKDKLWEYVLDLGKSEAKRGKVLNVYSHNARYDFYSYANLEDPNLKIYSERPFIISYKIDDKERIFFLDTWALYRMSLQALGLMIDLPKYELPIELTTGEDVKITQKMKTYLYRDTEIVLEAVNYMKDILKKDKVGIRRLYTIDQVAISYMLNRIYKDKYADHIWFDKSKRMVMRTKHPYKVHQAYRGGICRVFSLGHHKSVSHIDVNNLYGHSAVNMRFPDISSEELVYEPNETCLDEIGFSMVMLKNVSNVLGVLPVRTGQGNFFPKTGKYLIGAYSNDEIVYALKNGYELIHILWSVMYNQAYNPFKKIIPELYQKRVSERSDFNKYFYKQIMNRAFGKFAQKRSMQEIVIDSVDKANQYARKNYEILHGVGTSWMYRKELPVKYKKYYSPTIPALINSYARVFMNRAFDMFDKNELVYTDTDSIVFTGGSPESIHVSNRIGDFKLEHESVECMVYGRKTLSLGKNIKISGVRKKGLSIKEFQTGTVRSKRMMTLKTTGDREKIGTFITETRDLLRQMRDYEHSLSILENINVYIDDSLDIDVIDKFMPFISKATWAQPKISS